MDVSVVIVNYNVRYFLEQCIISVLEASKNIESEIIVVDNNSSDHSCSILSEKYPKVILLKNSKNVGFSKANNQGVEVAKGKYVLILNPDTILPEDLLSKVFTYAEKQHKFGALGVQLIDGSGNYLPESKRNIPTHKVSLEKLIKKSSLNVRYYANQLDKNSIGEVPVLVGAFMFIKTKVYNLINGFDEAFFMYGEDIDLSYRIVKAGYHNYYLGNVQVLHYKGESSKKDIEYFNNFYGAMQLFYEKHFKYGKLSNWIVKNSIKLLLKFKKNRNTINVPKVDSSSILYIGCDKTIFNKLNELFSHKKVSIFPVCTSRVISRYDDLEKMKQIIQEKNIDEIIFDNESTSFKKILFYISELKNKGIQFKIKPKNTDFLIGSNNSIDKGIVVKLN